jgi:hypothetical protein
VLALDPPRPLANVETRGGPPRSLREWLGQARERAPSSTTRRSVDQALPRRGTLDTCLDRPCAGVFIRLPSPNGPEDSSIERDEAHPARASSTPSSPTSRAGWRPTPAHRFARIIIAERREGRPDLTEAERGGLSRGLYDRKRLRPSGVASASTRLPDPRLRPREAAQVDWGEYGSIAVGTTRRRLSFFAMVPAIPIHILAATDMDRASTKPGPSVL